jgi:iron complex outermembrane receptor protein
MRIMRRHTLLFLLTALIAVAPAALAQQGTTVSGTLTDSLTGAPMAGATVTITELNREARSEADGRFTIDNVAPGSYHLTVRAPGYLVRRTEITVASSPVTADVAVDPQLHFTDVASVSPDVRSQLESYQPTSVLAGQELQQQLNISLGDTLQNQPGVASRSFGPAPARPVIRGLDGDRVLILQDGQRMGDLSSQSGDHGVTINPAAARRIEVVRGPATLLYGANAIGGLVNVLTNEVPTERQDGASGTATVDLGTAAEEAAGAADLTVGNGNVALQLGGGGRRTGDIDTPEGEVLNSQSRNAFGTVGLAWTGERSYFGGSYGFDDTEYGIPVVEGGILKLTPQRHSFNVRAGGQQLNGAFDGFRASLGVRRYEHDELEGDEVGTQFTNNTTEFELMGSHRAAGRLKGSVGGWFLNRAFNAEGEEALSPAVDQTGFAAFIYEEVTWPHVTLQFGGRVERASFTPAGEPERDFTNGSGSIGLLLRPAAADERLTVAFNLARAARNPALEELFFFGTHHGNFAFEIGNPDLKSEKAFGFDASLRWQTPRISGEITYFRNDISDFIFRSIIDEEAFEEREDEFAARFPDREFREPHAHGEEEHEEEELSIVEFVGADTLLQGVELHSDFQLGGGFGAEVTMDYVRGALKDSNDPLPRMPPFRFRGGLRYQRSGFRAGGEVIVAAKQGRVFGAEEPTGGYAIGKLFASHSFAAGGAVNTVTLRLDNVTDKLYRNHLSLIKAFVPEMGRNFKALYSVTF